MILEKFKQIIIDLLFLPPYHDTYNHNLEELNAVGTTKLLKVDDQGTRYFCYHGNINTKNNEIIDYLEFRNIENDHDIDTVIIHCNGKRRTYLNYITERIPILKDKAKWQLVFFNYRGIYPSSGKLRDTDQFYEDANLVVQNYIKKEKNIVITGHSMGGAVATYIASIYDLPLYMDRSFISMFHVVQGHLNKIYLGCCSSFIKKIMEYFKLNMNPENFINLVNIKEILGIRSLDINVGQNEDPVITAHGSMFSSTLIKEYEISYCYAKSGGNTHDAKWQELVIINKGKNGIENFVEFVMNANTITYTPDKSRSGF